MSSVDTSSTVKYVDLTGFMSKLGIKSDNPQTILAVLNMMLADNAKTRAQSKMKDIEADQVKQAEASKQLQALRVLRDQVKANNESKEKTGVGGPDWKKPSQAVPKGCGVIPKDMYEFCVAEGIEFDKSGDDAILSLEELDTMILNMQSAMEEMGTNVQQEMILIEDDMAQYNAYSTGAKSNIDEKNELLSTILR